MTRRELDHAHALYCAEVTLVDTWVGHLLDTIERLGLLADTAVFFTTDHGFYFGEHGVIGKALIDRRTTFRILPLYEEVARIPLLAHIPGVAGGRRIDAFVQPVDLMPTILDLAGVPDPGTTHGHSLLPLARGEREGVRDFAVSSYSISHFPMPVNRRVLDALGSAAPHLVGDGARLPSGQPSTVTTAEWSFVYVPPADGGATGLTVDVDGLARAVAAPEPGMGCALYHRPSDPGQERNVIADHPEVARDLHTRYLDFLASVGTAPAVIAGRSRLVI
jgi:hypothetical protein